MWTRLALHVVTVEVIMRPYWRHTVLRLSVYRKQRHTMQILK